ncbi:MAG: hypothetical protein ABFC96_06885 [Thermoguttaceae bacterium]
MHFATKLVIGGMLLIGAKLVPAAAETQTAQTESSSPRKASGFDEKEMDRTFLEIVKGGGRVLGSRESRWSKLRGRSLSEDIGFLRPICETGNLCSCCWPHRPGLIGATGCLSLMLEDEALLTQIEERLLGCDPSFHVDLRESPLLLKQLEVLSRNPYLATVKIDSRSVDARLAAAIKKLQVGQEVRHRHCRANAACAMDNWLEVGYSEGKCRIVYVLGPDFYKGRAAEGPKVARVEVDDAESAIPTLKAIQHLEYVELTRQGSPFIGYVQLDQKEIARAERVRRLLKESLPKVEVEQVRFDLR